MIDPAITQSRSNWIRLRTLTQLRWLAVFGQTAALGIGTYFLSLEFQIGYCAVAILGSVVFNLLSATLMHPSTRLGEKSAFSSLLFDLMQLAVLLYLTGGLHNPFAIFILVPITISATFLSLRSTLILAGAGVLVAFILGFQYVPLRFTNGDILEVPLLLLYGMMVSLALSVMFLAIYAYQVSSEIFSMSQALSATQLALAREHRLTALGGVVAATAHEMGTPLATIKLASSELAEELPEGSALREDATLILSQATRLGEILHDMGAHSREDFHIEFAPLAELVETAAKPHMTRGIDVSFRFNGKEDYRGLKEMPIVPRAPEILHGLRNLIQNAVDFAEKEVAIRTDWGERRIRISIKDDGPGFLPAQLKHIREPYSLPRLVLAEDDASKARPGYEGMGLGLFIAHTLLERTGARLEIKNLEGQEPYETGAMVSVSWDRARLETTSQS